MACIYASMMPYGTHTAHECELSVTIATTWKWPTWLDNQRVKLEIHVIIWVENFALFVVVVLHKFIGE